MRTKNTIFLIKIILQVRNSMGFFTISDIFLWGASNERSQGNSVKNAENGFYIIEVSVARKKHRRQQLRDRQDYDW